MVCVISVIIDALTVAYAMVSREAVKVVATHTCRFNKHFVTTAALLCQRVIVNSGCKSTPAQYSYVATNEFFLKTN